jgi:hypothetical protein
MTVKTARAFTNKQKGKVLGVWFDSSNLTWKLPSEKILGALEKIRDAVQCDNVSLVQMQSLMGSLNFLTMMCPFLKSFKYNLNNELSMRIKNEKLEKGLGEEAVKELEIFTNILAEDAWLLIAAEPTAAHPSAVTFTSDAAGLPNNKRYEAGIGYAAVGVDGDGSTIFAARLEWPQDFISTCTDEKLVRFGNKTATLEMLGIMLPILLEPSVAAGQHIIAKVDNIACVSGYENGHMKNDECASILIRATKVITAYLGTVLHVEHQRRRSSEEAELVDNMTRTSTMGFLENHVLDRFKKPRWPKPLTDWFENPKSDWNLPYALLNHVKETGILKEYL